MYFRYKRSFLVINVQSRHKNLTMSIDMFLQSLAQAPSTSTEEHWFLRLVRHLGTRQTGQGSMGSLTVSARHGDMQINRLAQPLRLAEELSHIIAEDLPALLAAEHKRLASLAESPALRSYFSAIEKLQRKTRRLSQHLMHLVSRTCKL